MKEKSGIQIKTFLPQKLFSLYPFTLFHSFQYPPSPSPTRTTVHLVFHSIVSSYPTQPLHLFRVTPTVVTLDKPVLTAIWVAIYRPVSVTTHKVHSPLGNWNGLNLNAYLDHFKIWTPNPLELILRTSRCDCFFLFFLLHGT